MRLNIVMLISFFLLASACTEATASSGADDQSDNLPDITGYPIVDTDQSTFFDNSSEISAPSSGEAFYGQDAQYSGNQPSYTDNGDGTVTDNVTSLMWSQSSDLNGDGTIDVDDKLSYDDALANASNFDLAGYSDWRLPTIKELQSIVDYTRSPETSNFAALDHIFNISEITNEAGEIDYPYFWSGTTHATWVDGNEGAGGAYISFGRAMGYMGSWIDVHGAGAQRSDPKTGDPANYPTGHGPQGDAIRIFNYVRLVRNLI